MCLVGGCSTERPAEFGAFATQAAARTPVEPRSDIALLVSVLLCTASVPTS